MGNECCSSRHVHRLNYLDLPDGQLLKDAILASNSREIENIVNLTPDHRVLNCIMDENKNSPLMMVCERLPTDTHLLDVMASAGAQVDLRNIQGETAIHILARCGSAKDTSLNSIKLLHKKHKLQLYYKDLRHYDALWNAVRVADLPAYKYLKSWGCDLRYVDHAGENVLFAAIKGEASFTGFYQSGSSKEISQSSPEDAASLQLTKETSESRMLNDISEAHKRLPLIKQMVEYDEVDIHQVNRNGESVLDVAAKHSVEILQYLKTRIGLAEKSIQ